MLIQLLPRCEPVRETIYCSTINLDYLILSAFITVRETYNHSCLDTKYSNLAPKKLGWSIMVYLQYLPPACSVPLECSVWLLIGVEKSAPMFSMYLNTNRGGAPSAVPCICAVVFSTGEASIYELVIPTNFSASAVALARRNSLASAPTRASSGPRRCAKDSGTREPPRGQG